MGNGGFFNAHFLPLELRGGTLNKLSLFSGIGGDDLASEWAEIKTICFVERDKYCQQVLKKHWPDVPIIGDVKDVTYAKLKGLDGGEKEIDGRGKHIKDEWNKVGNGFEPSGCCGVDIISGGFPCQPHSVAGKRKGSSDERNLWPEFRRIIGEIKPRWVVAENVPGLFSSDSGRFFGVVLSDLASLGYSVGWCTFGAVDVGALHIRDRVFIVAYAGLQHINIQQRIVRPEFTGSGPVVSDSISDGLQGFRQEWDSTGQIGLCGRERGNQISNLCYAEHEQCNWPVGRLRGFPQPTDASWWATEPDVGRVAHGVPYRVDRLKGLGNAVVPWQIFPIYKAIVEIGRSGLCQ